MNWKIIERPGHLGKKKSELYKLWNKEYGENNWKLVWEWGNQFLEKKDALQLYEDAYYEFARKYSGLWFKLNNEAQDIWDNSVTNIKSGINYDIQESQSEHIHDIAIRRVNLRKGLEFKGKELIRIRKPEHGELSKIFAPYAIPFQLPLMISEKEIKDYTGYGEWWLNWGIKNSVEQFYQKNKVLMIKD